MILEELQAIRGELEWIEKHGKVDAKKSGKKDEEMIEGILKMIEDLKKNMDMDSLNKESKLAFLYKELEKLTHTVGEQKIKEQEMIVCILKSIEDIKKNTNMDSAVKESKLKALQEELDNLTRKLTRKVDELPMRLLRRQ